MDFTKADSALTHTDSTRSSSRLDLRSFALGLALAFAVTGTSAVAFDLGGVTSSVKNLVNIKRNLDGDVKNLTEDAKMLLGSKDKLLKIKEALFKLAAETKSQIDLITTLVGEVDGHLKKTQADIQTTAKHVGEIDGVRKALSGK
jgi:hypothetical protein